MIALHAGLEKGKPVEDQLAALYKKDATVPRLETFFGRKNVWDIPEVSFMNSIFQNLVSGVAKAFII